MVSKLKDGILHDVANIQQGYAFKSTDFNDNLGTPVIKIKNISSGEVDLSATQYYSKEIFSLSKYLVKNGDILIAMTGSHLDQPSSVVGRVSRYTKNIECLLNQRTAKIIPNTDLVNSKFLYYSLIMNETLFILASNASGSANQANISSDQIYNLPLLLPSLPEQESIAELLSSLDDKIDLLHSNNKTLEQLAAALYRQWFVEDAGDNWEEKKLGEYIKTVNGYSYRSVDLNPSKVALVTLKNFERTGGFRNDGFKEYTGKYKNEQVVLPGDLIVAHTDITQEAEVLGNPVIVIGSEKYDLLIISTDLVKVIPTSYLSIPYLYFLMKSDEFKYYCLGSSNGTTVLHLSKGALPQFNFKLPPKALVNSFTIVTEPLLNKINNNQSQIVKLESLRDTILPKLMIGAVIVKI
jgi:type I restriction enzyme S subunit